MQAFTHLSGGAGLHKRFKIGATIANAGIPVIAGTAGVIPATTTTMTDTPGLGLDAATYSTAQGATHAEGIVTVSVRPDLVIRALMSGGATEGTALPLLVNTLASTDGLLVSDADVGTASMATGTMWCIRGANVGQSRIITTFNSATSIVPTVAFLYDIPVGDEFLQCPWAKEPGTGAGNLQMTTLFTQADALIVAGTGGVVAVVELELNGRGDSYVQYVALDHIYNVATL